MLLIWFGVSILYFHYHFKNWLSAKVIRKFPNLGGGYNK